MSFQDINEKYIEDRTFTTVVTTFVEKICSLNFLAYYYKPAWDLSLATRMKLTQQVLSISSAMSDVVNLVNSDRSIHKEDVYSAFNKFVETFR